MMLDTIEIPRAVARKKLDAVRKELKRRRKPIDDDLSRLERGYEAATEGLAIVDINQAIASGGSFDNGLPRIALAPAHRASVRVSTSSDWSGLHSVVRFTGQTRNGLDREVVMGPAWHHRWLSGRAPIPHVPSDVLQEAGIHRLALQHLRVLWEVQEWTPEPPRDPALLRPIAGALHAVLAVWDLSELERAVMRA